VACGFRGDTARAAGRAPYVCGLLLTALGACTAPVAHPALRSLSSVPVVADPVEPPAETLEQIRRRLLEEQDTDCDQRITREDEGSRRFRFRWQEQPYELSGGSVLSNLLEELTLDLESGQSPELARVMEDPIGRLSRVFASSSWDALTRRVDEAGLPDLLEDPSASPRGASPAGPPRTPGAARGPERTLYVPADDRRALAYFLGVAERYNSAYRRLGRATANLPLLGALSDASSGERANELVAVLRTAEGRDNFAELQSLDAGQLRLALEGARALAGGELRCRPARRARPQRRARTRLSQRPLHA